MTDGAAAAIEQPPAPKITAYALPGILAEIARLTSVDVAIAVARRWGGANISLPRVPKREHRLVQLVGHEAALIICGQFGGKRWDIPSARAALRWFDAHRLRDEGLAVSAIARRLVLTERRVRTLLQGRAPAPVPSSGEAAGSEAPENAVGKHPAGPPFPSGQG